MRPDGRPSGPRRPETARVFFALWPDPPLVAALASAAADGARRWGGRVTAPETLHLTLEFIGEVALDRLAALRGAADAVAVAPFDLVLDRLGFWRHNRIFWAGGEANPGLTALVRELGLHLAAAGFGGRNGGKSGGRPFVPHLTLVRNVRTPPVELPPFGPVRWECQEFVLVRSRLSAAGSAYEVLGRWPLRA